ncbi:MAG: hypothetical protein AB7T06_31630 [Kofleriaceae bacterium]
MRIAVTLALLAACYDPTLQPCAVRCSQPDDCAGGLTCGADGWCATGDRLDRCELPDAALTSSDAALTLDGAMADAASDAPPAVCAPGCNGSCEDGVCVIRCSGPNACGMDVKCPMTGPCRVECTGYGACRKKVVCGSGDCDVVCSGTNACKESVQCMTSCACDVTCSGDNSCEHAATCSGGPMCDTGDGCSATAAPVCNTCS